jgi:hypothetical protein
MAQELAAQLFETTHEITNARNILNEMMEIANQTFRVSTLSRCELYSYIETDYFIHNYTPDELLLYNNKKKIAIENFQRHLQQHKSAVANYEAAQQRLYDIVDKRTKIQQEMKRLREQYIWQAKENTVDTNIMSTFMSKIKK